MLFLGTAAADAMPNPFCHCPLCTDARNRPNRARLRSMFLLDDRNLIDFGPDLHAACIKSGVNLSGLRNIFITHTHDDHMCLSNLGLFQMSRSRNAEERLDLYLSETAYDRLARLYDRIAKDYGTFDAIAAVERKLASFHPVPIGVPFAVDEYRITAVRTTHVVDLNERAINYVFEKDGQKVMYACDTGYFIPETLNILRGYMLDYLILECTWGSRTDKDATSHLNCEAYLETLDTLLAERIITKRTHIYATHINHKHSFTHEELQGWFDAHSQFPVMVAYDGLRIMKISST